MAHYFFHLHNSIGFVPDEDGRELPDLGRVREEALKGIRSVIGAEALQGRIDLRGRIDVADASGGLVLSFSFEEAVEVKRGGALLPTEPESA